MEREEGPGREQGTDDRFVAELATRAAGLGREVAGIVGVLDDLSKSGTRQAESFHRVGEEMAALSVTNDQIGKTALNTEQETRRARTAVEQALSETQVLAQAVQRVDAGMDTVMGVLKHVSGAAEEIGQIAFQTRIVAFNASVEAVRAGERGRGFAVVAEAVKDLAQKVQQSSQDIRSTLQELGLKLEELAQNVHGDGRSGRSRDAGATVAHTMDVVRSAFDEVQKRIHDIADAASASGGNAKNVLEEVRGLDRELVHSVSSINEARQQAESLLELNENLIELTAESGLFTEDSPFIDAVLDGAARISEAFEQALARGQIREGELFDENYRLIAGTDPQQYQAGFVTLTDSLLPAIQEPLMSFSPAVTFCAAVDRNGYLPTHNRQYSQPQSRDPKWNAANCRNRRIFNDRTGLAAGRSEKRFLLQIYRRDMGNGQFVLMKDLSAPIYVNGRHWGGLRMGYKF
ncbi:MAG: methyl-accepting chemotaxis protein [Rhodocyclaceae bacterium]|nr:methyl-accepting chemotaxis protein [Rhodocyclaceae bacterium]